MSMPIFKYCCNGEIGYTRAPNIYIASLRVRYKYLRTFGKAELTDIKQVKPPRRERNDKLPGKVSGKIS